MHIVTDTVLTADDLPTLRKLTAHLTARAKHRGPVGAIACRVMARICSRFAENIERHGVMHPAIDYSRDRR